MTIPVAIYARVSSEQQAKGDSIEHQISFLNEYIASRLGEGYGTNESLIYKDEGISGYSTTLANRPAIQRMIEDAKKHRFQVALFKEISRMGRDGEEIIKLPRIFESHGVRVIATNDFYDSDRPESKALLPMSSISAERYSENLSLSVSAGLREKARSGKWTTYAPIGYILNKEARKLEVDEKTLPIVKMIFDLYVNQKIGTLSIAKHLNQSGYRTNKGNYFDRSVIRGILNNQAYIGTIIYGRTRSQIARVYDEKNNLATKKVKSVPRKDFITYKNAHPALIDEWAFWRAQEIMETRGANSQQKSRAKHPLVGVLYCEKCGKLMICQERNMVKNQYSYRYYKCSTAHKAGKTACNQDNIRADKLEEIIFGALKKHLNHAKREIVVAQGKVQTKSLDMKVEEISKEKAKLSRSQTQMTLERELYTDETFKETMLDIRNKIEHCEKQMHIIQQQIYELQVRETNITSAEEYITKMEQMNMNDLAPLRSLFHDLIESIDIRDKETISRIKYRFDF